MDGEAFKPGLRPVLLALLSRQPETGYSLGRLLRDELSHAWQARLQQVYAELSKLRADGLIQAENHEMSNRPAKKVYSLTPRGRRALSEWLVRREPWRQVRDDLLVELYAFPPTPAEVILVHVEQRRDQCEARVKEYQQRLRRARGKRELGYLLGLEAAVAAGRAELRWCNRAMDLVRRGQ